MRLDESAKNTDLWIHDIQRNSDTRLTFDKGTEIVPEWSPDDGKMYFSSNATGVFNIYEKNSNGTGDEQLVYGSKFSSYVTDVSHDGKKLLLSINTQGPQKWDIGMFDLAEKKFTPLLTSEFNEWLGTFSPDGKWFVYQSDETGKYEVYIRPTDGSPSKWQVSTSGGSSPRWLNNGKEIMYSLNDQQLFIVPVSVSGNEINVGQAKLLFKIDAGFQTNIHGYIERWQASVSDAHIEHSIIKERFAYVQLGEPGRKQIIGKASLAQRRQGAKRLK